MLKLLICIGWICLALSVCLEVLISGERTLPVKEQLSVIKGLLQGEIKGYFTMAHKDIQEYVLYL